MRPTLSVSVAISLLLIGSAPLAFADTVTISAATPFSDSSGATDKVKNECGVQDRLPKYIKSYAKKHTDVEFTSEALDTVEGKTLYLEFEHVYAPGGGGYSGAKSVSVVGELKENGEVIASLTVDRAALFGMTPGTCSMLKRVAKKLGQDIGNWLGAPEMDSMLGDAAN
jgi:hypothetical protein